MSELPANLDIEHARLPVRYIEAKTALAECAEIDVCRDWADKAEALASYARQANDKDLQKYSMRIMARAIERCGELLEAIPPSSGRQPENGETPPRFTRTQAAKDAGLSDDQRKTALRLANIDKDEFETAVESDDPPTITELAERGKRRRAQSLDHLNGRNPEDFHHATKLIGLIGHINRESPEIDLAAAIRGLSSDEIQTLNHNLRNARNWLAQIQLGETHGL